MSIEYAFAVSLISTFSARSRLLLRMDGGRFKIFLFDRCAFDYAFTDADDNYIYLSLDAAGCLHRSHDFALLSGRRGIRGE